MSIYKSKIKNSIEETEPEWGGKIAFDKRPEKSNKLPSGETAITKEEVGAWFLFISLLLACASLGFLVERVTNTDSHTIECYSDNVHISITGKELSTDAHDTAICQQTN